MRICLVPISFEANFSLVDKDMMWRMFHGFIVIDCLLASVAHLSFSAPSDVSTHRSDHEEDAQVETLPMVHVHGLRLNKDQQLGPVPQKTP